IPALSTGPIPAPGDFNGWPNYATDLLVARDPRSSETTRRADGKVVPRYLVVYLAIDGLADSAQPGGVFRGRFDRTNARAGIVWERRLNVPNPAFPATMAFGRVRLALCESEPQHVYAVMQQVNQVSVVIRITTAGVVGVSQFTYQLGTAAV